MKEVNEKNKDQKKDVKQTENWISTAEIQTVYSKLLLRANAMSKNQEIMAIPVTMVFFLVAFLGGVSGLSPRQSLYFGLLEQRSYGIKTDNHYKGGNIYFNSYKSAKYCGLQVVDVPKE